MTPIFAIDPGTTESAWVIYSSEKLPTLWAKEPNAHVLARCRVLGPSLTLVIEQVASMGMAVGEEVFETVFWSGRFAEAWHGQPFGRVKRQAVKLHLCGSTRANDGNIRQAIIDKYGGKAKAKGTKKNPGPLYGMAGDCWQALALAITYAKD